MRRRFAWSTAKGRLSMRTRRHDATKSDRKSWSAKAPGSQVDGGRVADSMACASALPGAPLAKANVSVCLSEAASSRTAGSLDKRSGTGITAIVAIRSDLCSLGPCAGWLCWSGVSKLPLGDSTDGQTGLVAHQRNDLGSG